MSNKGAAKPLTSLTPEQTRACEVTTSCLVLIDHLMVAQVPKQVMRTDYKAFCRERISRESLFHESSWIWNQSSGKRVIQLTPDVVITGCKYNARLKPSCAGQVLPKYKAWIFEVSRGILPPVWFLWCEKGYEGPPQQTPSYRNNGQAFSWGPHSEPAQTASRIISAQVSSSHFGAPQVEGGPAAFTFIPDRISALAADSRPSLGAGHDSSFGRSKSAGRGQREAIIFPNAPQFMTSFTTVKRQPLSTSMPPDLVTSSLKIGEFNANQIDALMSEWMENL